MTGRKHFVQSKILGRMAHFDVFEPTAAPQFCLLFFGGSGIDEEEYAHRSQTVIPVFDNVLSTFSHVPMTFVYVTAPYDVPLRRFAANPALATGWNEHILGELLTARNDLPFYLASFSGGAALAYHGVHTDERCRGGAAMGVDGLSPTFQRPPHWSSPLRCYCGRDDRVCQHVENQAVLDQLTRREQVEVIALRSGAHRLADYATPECLGRIIVDASQSVLQH